MRFAAIFLLIAAPAAAQSISTSAAPDSVAVTVYRAPGRSAAERFDPDWLTGYSLITETRSVQIPEGVADIRFEGVAGGIIPESAIVSGLPDGVVEKNQDAQLLSPASLLDRSLGERVHLKRTSLATGKVTEQDAIVRTGAGGAVVLQTAAGFEALRCTGLKESLVYPRVPEGLSAKPTLSVRTRSSRAASATVTLSYLATGFDWQANYVGKLAPDGRHIDLFAWVTLANSDPTSFRNASTNAVAGRLNTEAMDPREPPRAERLRLRCWPADTTGGTHREPVAPPPPPPPPPPASAPMAERDEMSIVVTGTRIAKQEELGDLKLYRIPEPVTVAAKSQKQVAMIDKGNVPVEILYRGRVRGTYAVDAAVMMIRLMNRADRRLGVPLPAGGFALFQEWRGRPLLVGEGSTEDKAVGEKVEIELAGSTGVRLQLRPERINSKSRRLVLTATNDQPRAVPLEVEIRSDDERLSGFIGKVVREDGKWVWRVTLPANGSRSLAYRMDDVG